jgi:hypothetical protein
VPYSLQSEVLNGKKLQTNQLKKYLINFKDTKQTKVSQNEKLLRNEWERGKRGEVLKRR